MLHESPLIIDVDVDQWRNLQNRFLVSARERKRIVVIHEDGIILKFRHSHGESIVKSVPRITNPYNDAKRIYEDNKDKVDFVLILDRKAVEKYVAEFQDSWNPDEDLDEYVLRMYELLDKYKDYIVTYPGTPKEVLGLQLKLGISYSKLKSIVQRYVPPMTTVVIGIFEDSKTLWASLILGFDADKKLRLISTLDKSLITTDWKKEYKKAIEFVEKKFWKCSIGLFMDKNSMENLLASKDKLRKLWELTKRGDIIVDPMSEPLKFSLKWLELHTP